MRDFGRDGNESYGVSCFGSPCVPQLSMKFPTSSSRMLGGWVVLDIGADGLFKTPNRSSVYNVRTAVDS